MYYLLDETLYFPPIEKFADEYGILAIGGDLSVDRLLLAYRSGIFPWYSEDEPITWWSPDPRFVLFPQDLKISKSMKQILKKNVFQVTFDTAFRQVITECQQIKRVGQKGTWITHEMLEAYVQLHELGYAHSVEVWQSEELVGGLYGVSLGQMYFGESMFSRVSNSSKTGFIVLVQKMIEKGIKLIDSQVYTNHLASLGAIEIPRKEYLRLLAQWVNQPTLRGKWTEWLAE
ncbi:MAG: leucyl/phenylalanyl-tRNA--protein transferase [Microscillaceae bacterium]|nr:leucyl/phenylalanyl-tRNA--protein transferase [Microscillaceae bacterium]MDW8459796.1 leucyl/phenylalanyl-tRNA--protein transferase [Cytophagales bacterium]